MKFSELPKESKERARDALRALLTTNGVSMVADHAKAAGEYVSAAFIAMEHHDSDPDVCDDGKVKIGDSNSAENVHAHRDFRVDRMIL